jgi:hypothetical protein
MQPSKLVLHDDPYDIWSKLSWEANEYELRRTDERPLDVDGMVYLLQNACISAVAVVEWLRRDCKRAVRQSGGDFDDGAFDRDVENSIPELQLARAIANTFKHGEYRVEGLGTVETRLKAKFDDAQNERLRAAKGALEFERIYSEEAAEADFRLTFERADSNEIIEGHDLVQSLNHGALRLLDASFGDHEHFLADRANKVPPRE